MRQWTAVKLFCKQCCTNPHRHPHPRPQFSRSRRDRKAEQHLQLTPTTIHDVVAVVLNPNYFGSYDGNGCGRRRNRRRQNHEISWNAPKALKRSLYTIIRILDCNVWGGDIFNGEKDEVAMIRRRLWLQRRIWWRGREGRKSHENSVYK